MSAKPQLISSIPAELWGGIGAAVTAVVAWLIGKVYKLQIEDQLAEIKDLIADSKKEIESLKAQVSDLRTTAAERKAIAEAQGRTLERIQDRLEKAL